MKNASIVQTASLNYLKIAPRKTRSVGDLLKGLPVNEAEAQLLLQRRRPAKDLLKLLRSAVADATNNKRLNRDHLFVVRVLVNQGPMLKRRLPRARGTATPIQKKMSHATILLGVNEKLVPKYKIVVEKKAKLPQGDEKPTKGKREKQMLEGEGERGDKDRGFFKRVFSPKSRASK